MNPTRFARHAAAALCLLLPVLPAHAQLFRTYLASDGSDANPCTLPAPCRLLPAAIAAVADGGEIWMLDSANYNATPVQVTKSVTILAVPGALGSVVAIAGPAFNIATAGVKVALRNLVIVPFPNGSATSGVLMTNGARLTIEGCSISNMPDNHVGIYVNAAAQVQVVDTILRGNQFAIWVDGGATATIASSKLVGNTGVGVNVPGVVGNTRVAISDTIIEGLTSSFGISADAELAGAANISVVRSTISGHNVGVSLGGSQGLRTVSIGSSMLTGNFTALYNQAGGTIESLGNNLVTQNGNNVNGSITGLTPL